MSNQCAKHRNFDKMEVVSQERREPANQLHPVKQSAGQQGIPLLIVMIAS